MTDTRGARGRSYTLITPANHYASRLPSLPGAQVVKLVTPRLAPARLGQYLVTLGDDPVHAPIVTRRESFLFGLDGPTRLSWDGATFALGPRAFVYLHAATQFTVQSPGGGSFLWLTRAYEPWPGVGAPASVHGDADAVTATATATPGLTRRELIDPLDPRHDFNMSLMSFEPGVGLPQIEIHDEEHGLYMTRGGGSYTLERDRHEVAAGDFIYMAPYCPQGFEAGADGAEYLLYKDVYRDGF